MLTPPDASQGADDSTPPRKPEAVSSSLNWFHMCRCPVISVLRTEILPLICPRCFSKAFLHISPAGRGATPNECFTHVWHRNSSQVPLEFSKYFSQNSEFAPR